MEKDSIHIANCNSGDNNDEDDDDKDGGNASDNNNKCDWIVDDSEAAGSKKICNLMSYQQDNVDPSIKRRNYHNEDMSFHDSAHAGLGVTYEQEAVVVKHGSTTVFKKDEDNNNNNKCDWIEGEEEIEEPGDNDIILGRGGWSSNHQGNVNFRKLVSRYKIQYLACGKNDKPWVSKLVVKMWRNQSPPGRFLRRVDKALTTTTTTTGSSNIDIDIDTATPKYRPYVWREVTEKRSQAKASQCLRERTDGVLPYLQGGDIMGNVMMGTSTSASTAAASNHQRHNNNNSNNNSNNNNNNNIMPSTMMGMYAHQRPNMATTSLGGNIMNINSPVPTSLNYLQAQAQMHMAMKRRAIQNAYILNTTKAQSGNNNIHTYPHAHTNMSTRQQQQQQEMMRKQAMMMKLMMMKKRQAARMMMYKQYQQPRSNNNNNSNMMMAAAGCGATGMMQASNSLGIDQYGENMMNQQQHMMKQQQQQQQLAMDTQENDRFVRSHAVTNPNSDMHTPHHNTFKQTMEDKSEMNDENYTNSSKNLDDDNDGIGDGIDDDVEGQVDNNEGRVDNDDDDDNDVGHCDEGQPIPLSVMPDDSQQSPATGNEAIESNHDCPRKMSVTTNREGSDIASSAALAAAASELSLSDTIVDGDHKTC